uniref:macrophage mannose receptor 1-like isoform X2 n=1 Tax=Scatophagus argus TaxID=75038 RepID=UPI001ED7FF56|nr:macrophage mannose receptor 1-like isoform X2 [Scatophagus argus]
MRWTAVLMVGLSGLCFLPACFPRFYILVEEKMTWNDAQSYCRWKYTDLASVRHQKDMDKLRDILHEKSDVWIGLHADPEAWKWSLENQDSHDEGEAGFRMWARDEPSGLLYYTLCAGMEISGEWADHLCSASLEFICYNGTEGRKNSSFILVNEAKNWPEAQSYCRKHHTDLADVRNQAENDQLKTMVHNQHTWIGLYRDSWKWSDGSTHTFVNWASSAPSTMHIDSCVISNSNKWINRGCQSLYDFACYTDRFQNNQVVRVVLKKTDSSVDMEGMKYDILKGFNQKLKDHGLSEDINLKWVKQPDGKIFHREEREEEEEEKVCDNNPNKLWN